MATIFFKKVDFMVYYLNRFAVEQMETLVAESGSTEKVIEDLLAATEKRFRVELDVLGQSPTRAEEATLQRGKK